MNFSLRYASIILAASVLAIFDVPRSAAQATANKVASYKTIEFDSLDGLLITADLYQPHEDAATPFIVLCHQAGWSRGEYREIAPKLGKLGFNCLAIDQRSGKAVEGVKNETALRAKAAGRGDTFIDAEQDLIAALQYARQHYARGKLLLWGSSYSSALTLRIAGEQPKLVDGALAFAPGEYFERFGKPKNWITQSAAKITVPTFITSAKNEGPRWESIYAAIPGDKKSKFLPTTAGNHGSRALWSKFPDSDVYWKAATDFLAQFQVNHN